MRFKKLPSQERLRQAFDYDQRTGNLIWKSGNNPKFTSLIGKRAGTKKEKGIGVLVDGGQYYAHRLIWVWFNGALGVDEQIDHKNCNPFDNRIDNLRRATHSQNGSNSRLRRNRKYNLPKGVYHYNSSGRFKATIGVDGKIVPLGVYDTTEQAHAAYLAAAKKFKGEFARAA